MWRVSLLAQQQKHRGKTPIEGENLPTGCRGNFFIMFSLNFQVKINENKVSHVSWCEDLKQATSELKFLIENVFD